ncbi:OmpH family outer membrane protein [Robertkochia sediminum]|uniref:OmpH family outer membrane protein n=1 Tax=Robertkochia sediminum TaxID=2785326 RepID=UPI00193288D0|nr:OmpH family outer membrane protein [Robertkochia sediminum]MBL7472413.1 OmpH family outer membrane protein [Robertkochia sediminum]
MRIKVLFLLLSTLMLQAVSAQRSVRIGYVDMDYILAQVQEYKVANELLEKKVDRWKQEVEEQQLAIDQMRQDLDTERILLTKELIEERELEIKALEQEVLDYQQDRFGPQGDLVRQRTQLVKPVQDQVFSAVQELAQSRKYDFIFDRSADVVMLFAEKRYDLSDQVLRMIDVTRKTTQRNGEPSVMDAYKEEDPELKARKSAYEEKVSERDSIIEARRAAKLKQIEERKKAYEERRKKMLEEREAKRKAREEKKKEENGEENSGSTEENK